MANIFDIENTSLEAHVSLCAERYHQLDTRLTSVEIRLGRLESTLVEIRDLIAQDRNQLSNRFLIWASMIISILTGSCGYLLTHYVLK